MKNMKILLVIFVTLLFTNFSFTQVSTEIQNDIKIGRIFEEFNLFESITKDLTANGIDRNVLDKGILADLNLV